MPASPERLLLSSVLANGDYKVALAHGVVPDMFQDFSDEWGFLTEYFNRFKKVPSRATFRSKFPDFTFVSADDTVYLAEEVKTKHVQNVLIEGMGEIAELVSSGDLDAAIRKMNSSLVQVSAGVGVADDSDIFTDFKDILDDVEGRHKRAKTQGSAGIPYGIPSLDAATGGKQPGELIIIAARLGQGKSWLMQYLAGYSAAQGSTVVFDALEQTRATVSMRIHALMSGCIYEDIYKTRNPNGTFNSNSLLRGQDYDPVLYRRFLRDLKDKVVGALHVSDISRGRVSPMTVASQIEKHMPDEVYVDYITLMQKSGADWQGVAELSSDMTQLGTRYQIPVVCAAQLNREHGLGRDPAGPEAIAQGDSIGQDASVVITTKQWSKRVIAGRLAKNRNGEGDIRFYLFFDPGNGVIREISFNKAQDIMDEDKDAAAAAQEASK